MSQDPQPLMQFADVLLPGDGLFPAASASGMAEIVLVRLQAHPSSGLGERLLRAIEAAGGPLAPLSSSQRAAVVARLQKSEPKLFDDARKLIYISYYEQDSVVAAIRSLGTPYNAAPLPDGYPAEAFDSGRDAPKHRRGHWVATGQVARFDLSSLEHSGADE